jgi:hypothetical protein
MTEEPQSEPDAAVPHDGGVDDGPSTALVLPARRSTVGPPRRWADVAVRARRQLDQLRQNPAAMVAVSAAATVGSALVTAGLRGGFTKASLSRADKTVPVAIGGYVVHEVHVIHHVVHHVIRPPAD